MSVKCNQHYCKYWSIDAGDYVGVGGCILDEITIDSPLTGAGYIPICTDYEEEDEDE